MNQIKQPDVKNIFKQGDFVLEIIAYRKMTANEIMLSAAEFLRQKKLRTFPKRGTAVMYTMIGFDGR